MAAQEERALLTIEEFAGRLKSYLNPEQVNLVRRAYYYAEQAHDGQTRRSGEPYITHPSRWLPFLQTCTWIIIV